VAGAALARVDRAMLPSLRGTPTVALAAGAGASVLLVPGLPVVAATAAGTAIYAGAALALRAVPPELLEAFARRRR
jgi:hypothetical protein